MPEIHYYVAPDGRQPFADAAHAYWQDYKLRKRGRR